MADQGAADGATDSGRGLAAAMAELVAGIGAGTGADRLGAGAQRQRGERADCRNRA